MRIQIQRPSFTLIELLVVVAIISILASMLLPALSRARDAAREATCQSQLKQVFLAARFYAEDNGETYVPTFFQNISWGERLVGGRYITEPKRVLYEAGVDSSKSYRWWPAYGYVEYNQANNRQGKKMSYVIAPVITSMFADHNVIHANTTDRTYYAVETTDTGTQYMKTVANYSSGFLGRHLNGDNFIFVDGHVEHLTRPMDLTFRMRGVTGYGTRNMHPFNLDNDEDPNG